MNETTGRLSDELLHLLAHYGHSRTYSAGETLLHEGDASEKLYVLLEGRLKVFTGDAGGRELTYNSIEPGEVFGEMFLDGEPRSASVKALTEAKCVVLTNAEVRTLMLTAPEFTEGLILKLISRLRNVTRKLRSVVLESVYERTIALLEKAAIVDDEIRRIPRHLTQQEIANQVGASREMVNHVLRDLVRGGFLVREPRRGMRIVKKLPLHW